MKLYLDDKRIPIHSFEYTKNGIYLEEWNIVKNYEEFVKYITENEMPEIISFDHDIADEHYTPQEYWHDYEASKAYQESQVYKEKTGYDCAKALVEYCAINNISLPNFICHSMNPVGKDNILNLLNNYKKYESEKSS